MAETLLLPMRQSKEVEEEVAWWNKEFDRCKQIREKSEREWLLNLSFYLGKQYVAWAPANMSLSNQRLLEPAVPRNRVRIVANKIKPAIRMELTKLTKQEPQFYVEPATTEPTDVAAAKVAETISEFYLHELKFNKIRRQTTFWMLICGSAFMKPYIAGTSPALDCITAFHLFVPDLQEEDIQKQEYVIHGRAVKTAFLEDFYEVKVNPTEATDVETKLETALNVQAKSKRDMTFVKEIWVKSNKKYPAGAMLIIANDQLLQVYTAPVKSAVPGSGILPAIVKPPAGKWSESAFPFAHGKYPFNKMDHIPSGKFYGLSVIDDLRPLQVEYNKTRSQIIESKNRMAKPQIYYQKGSIDPTKVTSEPGQMIPINPGFNFPQEKQLTPLPSYVLQEQDRTLRDMDELSGQTETDRGRTPPGIEAATAIAYLQEANDTRMYHTVASIEECVSDTGTQLLSLVNEFVPHDDLVEIVSKNNTIEIEQFKSKLFTVASDFRVESGSMAPKSAAARQAFITGLMEKGLIPPEKGLRYLQMNETNRLYEELQVDSKQAQRENYMMSTGRGTIQVPAQQQTGTDNTGQPIMAPVIDPNTQQPTMQTAPLPTNLWDNHQIHEYEHALFLKSQEYELIQDEMTKQVIQAHYIAHKNELMTLMQQQQQQLGAQNAAGTPANS